jgi:hypothetical protein
MRTKRTAEYRPYIEQWAHAGHRRRDEKPLLKHLVEITAHREHSRLAISVISALYQLTGVQAIRMLDIFTMRDEYYVQEKMVIRDGAVHTIAELTSDDPKEPCRPIRP